MTTPAKKRAAPQPVTKPVIPEDDAFATKIAAEKDEAVVKCQKLTNDKMAREGFYEKELQRLETARKADLESLDEQIARQTRIQVGCDAAIEAMRATNVVQLSGQAA